MAKFDVTIDCSACATFEIEAENQDQAYEKAEEFIQQGDFFVKYREQCDFFDPTVYTGW